MRLSGLFLAVTLTTSMWAAELTTRPVAEPSLWRFSRPDAKLLVGLNWHKLAHTDPGKLLQQQLTQAGVAGADDLATLSAIDQVLVSTVSGPDDKNDPPMVITLRGHFSLAKLRQLALNKKATIKPYKLVDVITPAHAEASDLHVALVNAETIVLGDRKSLLAAIDGSKETTLRSGNALYSRAASLTSHYDMWFATYAPAPDAKDKGPMAMLSSVNVIDGGLSATDKVHLELNLNTNSAADASALANVMTTMMALIPADQKAKKPGLDLLKNVSVKAAGNTVKVALALEAKEIQQQAATFAPMMGNMMAGNFDLKGIVLPAPPASTKPPVANPADEQPIFKVQVQAKAPEPQFVTIYGLDSGPRRVQIQ